jgi:hypothetical protein
MINGCILYPKQYSYIYKISFLSFFSSLYAIYRGYYDLALVPGSVFLTSINYWRKPDYSWRRYFDVFIVLLVFTYQNIRAYKAEYMYTYYTLITISVFFFFFGIYLFKINEWWYSVYSHCLLHFFANLSNFILYSGHIAPLFIV